MPGATAIAFGKAAAFGMREYLVLVPTSLVLGFACAALLNMMRRTAHSQLTALPPGTRNWYLPPFYVAVIVWMVAAGILGVLLASFVARLIR